jgi:hypothetical protein
MVVQMATPSRALDDIRGRMLELIWAGGIFSRMMHETAPVAARQMGLDSCAKSFESTVQVRSALLDSLPVAVAAVLGIVLLQNAQAVHYTCENPSWYGVARCFGLLRDGVTNTGEFQKF